MNIKYIFAIILTCFVLMPVCYSSAENAEIDQLLDRVESAIKSQGQIEWQAIVLSNVTEFDKKGKAIKETRIKRRMITGKDGEIENEILEAVEIEDGKTLDVTQKSIDGNNDRKDKNKSGDSRGTNLDEDQLFPFDKKSRGRYTYRRLDDSAVDGKPVFVIETKAIEGDTDTYEGKYYFDRDLFKILKLSVKPVKTPMFIKEISIEIDFKILPGNLSIIDKTTSRMKGKFLFKHFNVLIEENYTEHKIL